MEREGWLEGWKESSNPGRPLLEGVNWERIQTRPCAMPLIDIVCLQFDGGFLEVKAGTWTVERLLLPERRLSEKTRAEHVRGFDKLGNAAGERRKILENRSRTARVAVGDINSPPKLPRRIIALFVSSRFGRWSVFVGELTLKARFTTGIILG